MLLLYNVEDNVADTSLDASQWSHINVCGLGGIINCGIAFPWELSVFWLDEVSCYAKKLKFGHDMGKSM